MPKVAPRHCVPLLLIACLPLAGCGSGSGTRSTLLRLPVYGTRREMPPGIFDPARYSPSIPIYLTSLLHAGLVKFGPDMHVIPDLAVSIPTISSNGRSYTFTIRQDARFADGTQCTARDVGYSLSRALGPRTGSVSARRYLGNIAGASQVELGTTQILSGVRALDRLTVRIRLAKPDAAFLDKLAFPNAAIVEPASARNHPSGLGPWMLAGVASDGAVTLVPRPHFDGDPTQVRQIRLVPVVDQKQGVELYRRGHLDTAIVPDDQYAALSRRTDFVQTDGLDTYDAIPARGGVALSQDLDRSQLLSSIPSLAPLVDLVPPAVPDYVASPPATVSRAKDSLRVRLISSSTQDGDLALLRNGLAHRWKISKRGIRVRLVHLQFALPEPGRWLLAALGETKSGWYRGLLRRAGKLTNDPVSRMNLYSQAENWALSRGLVIPLASGHVAYLIRSSVQNLQVTPLGPMPANNNWTLVSG